MEDADHIGDEAAEARARRCRMANRIAAFFHPYGESEAVGGIAEHINRFWTSAMRRALAADIAAGADGFDPLVTKAAALVKA